MRKAKLEKQQLIADFTDIKKRIQLEVSTSVYAYEEALSVYDFQFAQLKSTAESFKVIQSKYKQNQVLLVEFNDARTKLTKAQLNESIARFNIKIAKANLNKTVQMN